MKSHFWTSWGALGLGLLSLSWSVTPDGPGDETSSSATLTLASGSRLRVPPPFCCENRPPRSSASAVPRGIPVGPWTVPPDLLGPVYNGGVLTGKAPYRDLEQVRSHKGQVVLYLARKKSQDQFGTLSVEAVRRFVSTWPDISSYIRDGTVWGII